MSEMSEAEYEALIAEMSKEHLDNALKLFERAGWGHHAKMWELRRELARRKT